MFKKQTNFIHHSRIFEYGYGFATIANWQTSYVCFGCLILSPSIKHGTPFFFSWNMFFPDWVPVEFGPFRAHVLTFSCFQPAGAENDAGCELGNEDSKDRRRDQKPCGQRDRRWPGHPAKATMNVDHDLRRQPKGFSIKKTSTAICYLNPGPMIWNPPIAIVFRFPGENSTTRYQPPTPGAPIQPPKREPCRRNGNGWIQGWL